LGETCSNFCVILEILSQSIVEGVSSKHQLILGIPLEKTKSEASLESACRLGE
jgi:hypothetical protein